MMNVRIKTLYYHQLRCVTSVQDFLLYNRKPSTQVEEVQSILRTAVSKSAVADRTGRADLTSIPVGPVGSYEPVVNKGPHWSQWPQPLHSARLPKPVRPDLSPRAPCSARELRQYSHKPTLVTWKEPETVHEPVNMNMSDRSVIMNRGLSPRRAAPKYPGSRSLTHYGSFGNREDPNPYIGGLDLHASPYNANRGFNQGITSHSSRQSRPMHRHLRTASKGEEYLHNSSIFYSTTPMATGYFSIHPDWVSERLSLRRSQSLLSF
ncbi:uncharacterized protein [Littorina saxatilis]|uniref:uncharacterized protein isoform X2 n=1 Tax=Littorina saxatilis TaxID=31220 RepID=UPI0038B5E145